MTSFSSLTFALEEALDGGDNRKRNLGVAAILLDVVDVVTELEEGSHDAATAEEHIARHLQRCWVLLNLALNLLWQEVLVLVGAIAEAEGESGELSGQDHGVGRDVHVPATEVSHHAVDVRAAQVQEDKGKYPLALRLARKDLHHGIGDHSHEDRVDDLASVHVELQEEACDSGEQMPRKGPSHYEVQYETKWVSQIHAEHDADLV